MIMRGKWKMRQKNKLKTALRDMNNESLKSFLLEQESELIKLNTLLSKGTQGRVAYPAKFKGNVRNTLRTIARIKTELNQRKSYL